jgi:arabinofuranan 3-O-arabinosyltransferase
MRTVRRHLVTPARICDVVVVAVLGVVLALQNVGLTRFDTKLDLVVNPWGFVLRGLNAWDPSAGFGQLQNQAYGYLFPMGPFFGVLHTLGVPAWIQQWWWAWLLLTLAYLGMRLVATRLGLPWWAALAGGVAYALAPRIVSVLGPLSAEVLATALMPWMILPLLRPSPSLRRTAFLSALPVLFMGAANATLTVSVLLVPAVWILLRSQNRWRLFAWWAGFVAALCAWWIVPLLVQARYATPFLSFIESARDTTVGLTPGEVIRGDVHWVSGIIDQGTPWWPAAFVLSTSALPVLLTFVLAGVGLAGLASRRMPERLTNGVLVLAGTLLLSAGALSAPFHGLWWELLDGALAPFRNIHKFDPVVRFPLALGVAAACAALADRVGGADRRGTLPARSPGWAVAGIGVILLGVASPLVSPGLAAGKTWAQIPPWWQDASDWLAQREPSGRALVVPGSGFGQYMWGRTIDEPLQPLSTVPWAVDNALPLGSLGSARVLDSVSMALAGGRRVDGLADLLGRSGIRFVVVRNDLDTRATLAPPRSAVAATLQQSPGIEWRAAFGEVTLPANELLVTDFAVDGDRPALEVYEVTGSTPMVEATALEEVSVMTGGPESLLPVLSGRILDRTTPVVFAGDQPPSAATGVTVITDSLLRRDRALGLGSEAFSGVLTAEEPSRVTRRANDLVPFTTPSYTVATYRGVSGVSASSSQSFGNALGPLRPERQPFAALDGNMGSWWQSSSVSGPVGQWWQADFPVATNLQGLVISVVESALVGSTVTAVELQTNRGRWREPVGAGGVIGPLDAPSLRDASYVRITAVEAQGSSGHFGIREVRVPRMVPSQPLITPMPPTTFGRSQALQLAARQPLRAACMHADGEVRCAPQAARPDGDGGVLDRLVTLREPVEGKIRMRGLIKPGDLAAQVFNPLGVAVEAQASSWLSQDPRVRPGSAVDGDPETAWVADLGDMQPELTLAWELPRIIDGLWIRTRQTGQQFAQPLAVRLVLGDRVVESAVGRDGYVSVPDIVATSMSLQVTKWSPLASEDSRTGRTLPMPVHISEVEIPALADLLYSPDLSARSGSLCGFGPTLFVGGREFETRVDATLGEILSGHEVSVIPCGSDTVRLEPGTHRITVKGSRFVDPVSVTIAPRSARAAEAAAMETRRPVDIVEWQDARRVVAIAPGVESILRVAESANDGWVAELDGLPLDAVRVDGWQQGWVIPAGEGGDILLTFRPQAQQTAGLLAGVGLILLALVVGLVRRPMARVVPAGAPVPWAVRRPYTGRAQGAVPLAVGVLVVATWSVLVAGVVGLACAAVALVMGRLRIAPLVVFGALSVGGAFWILGRAGLPDALAVLGIALASVIALTRRRE